MAHPRVLALDFVGTLAGHGPAPDGALVADVLRRLPGTVVPREFAARFDTVTQHLRRADRGVRSTFATRLRRTAEECGALVPSLRLATEAVFTAVPDARVDPVAARAVRQLHARGLVCVLAANTDRPAAVRLRTLRDAGIGDCFDALVLSSTLGVRKPDPRFYVAVTRAAGCPPDQVLFVGDNPETDALGPHLCGMSAVLVTSRPRPAALPSDIVTVPHLSALADHLNRLGSSAS
ncbi:Pyrimidine 5'-nucleotidase YjjG [Streptomyces hundungensis]|uniref:Pyrimidine 5'-nucleotidase YjjG n=1 Tax=Streptomyces hundungensis TaxID=1077946 RepID=A0A387HS20_9ACTN|nr:HAD family hydrolase [Streptomyces hundungensis]AYG84722.1 Pyrimidine 5'-nucleotidase YjjG [Streptomyces hundungensis]